MPSTLKSSTLLIHADDAIDPTLSSVAPVIYQTSTFKASDAPTFSEMATAPRHDRFYTRYGNPTHAGVEAVVAALEGAEAAMLTASGMGAITTAMWALLSAGDHVVAQRSLYGGTLGFLQNIAPRFGIEVTLVDQADVGAFEAAMTGRTKLLMLESPSNPVLALTDLQSVTTLARDHGVLTLADNTLASPINQSPLNLGVDLVMHSATKHLGGHSDLSAGVLAGSGELIERVWNTAYLLGSTLGPFDAWLLLRGLRTLKLRVEQQNKAAQTVAEFLAQHPAVEVVHYPGLGSHPQHDLARQQMRGYGGVMSFEVRGGFAATDAFIGRLNLPVRSASFGSVDALVVHPAAMWAGMMTDEQLQASGVAPGLVRYAVGLEDPQDLIDDLMQALEPA